VSRKAVTVSEWTVKINGVDRISVKPGECVEIGRKPLRPLADDGNTRLDVADQTKSMSKRHAMFTVKSNGTASVRDLGSTNGSYVVRENGDLLRLPANAEFLLPTSPMRMQFGDVPADFIRVDDPVAKPLDLKVPDLFGYAVHEAPQEPDAADMSVDDILDLRAGEPTAIFSADNVRRKVDELELGSLNITQPVTKNDEPAIPRDLFADALAQHAEQETERKNQQAMNSVALPKQQTEPESTIVTPASKHSRISGIVPVDAIAHAVVKHAPSTSEPAVASAAVVESDVVAGASKSAENVQSAPNTRNAGDSQPADTVEQHAEVAQPEAAREAGAPLFVIDGAVIVGTDAEKECDHLCVVTAPFATSVARIAARDGIAPEMAARRLNAQTPEEVLLARADLVLRNDADLASLEAAAAALCEQLQAEGARKGGADTSL